MFLSSVFGLQGEEDTPSKEDSPSKGSPLRHQPNDKGSAAAATDTNLPSNNEVQRSQGHLIQSEALAAGYLASRQTIILLLEALVCLRVKFVRDISPFVLATLLRCCRSCSSTPFRVLLTTYPRTCLCRRVPKQPLYIPAHKAGQPLALSKANQKLLSTRKQILPRRQRLCRAAALYCLLASSLARWRVSTQHLTLRCGSIGALMLSAEALERQCPHGVMTIDV